MTGSPLTSFWALAAVCGATGLAGVYLAWIEYQRGVQHSRMAFDLTRSLAITMLGWAVIALSTVIDPIRMGASVYVAPTVMATGTFLCFLMQAIGYACFLAFRLQSLRGRHPFDVSVQKGVDYAGSY